MENSALLLGVLFVLWIRFCIGIIILVHYVEEAFFLSKREQCYSNL
jgi:hypothetical protein